jgi:TonB family protein
MSLVLFGDFQASTSGLGGNRPVQISVAAHLALLAAIVFHHTAATDLTSESLAFGNSAHSYRLVYFPPTSDEATAIDAAKLSYPRNLAAKRSRQLTRTQAPAPQPEQVAVDVDAGDRDSKVGAELGTLIDGPITGHEVHVAYPVIYPDPPVERSELPRDLIGDVVIEVTIDSQGNVVETKIVQAIGHGIDEKIEATLRRWRYAPATLDGTPVASRHDVHFHFPS